MRNSIRTIVVLLGIAQGLAGCRGKESSPSPVSPSPEPPAPVTGLQPRITEVAPTTSTTAGGAWGTISGTGFEPGARVAFGAAAPLQVFVPDSSTVQFWTNAHEAGTVDVVVRNPSGREDTLARGYTFAPPESFDFNGSWVAHAGDEYETDMRFVVENNRLKSVTCGASPTVMFPAPLPVSHGEFSFVGEDGLSVSGRIVSAANAVGEINVAPCATRWWADKR